MEEDKKIVFYDGDCGFCNHTVQFIFNKEKNQEIYFCPLQSEFAKQFFEKHSWTYPTNFDSVIFFNGEKSYSKSTAALKICRELRFPTNLLQGLLIIPNFLRDPFYNLIAKNRKRLFKGFCFLPNEEQRKRMIS